MYVLQRALHPKTKTFKEYSQEILQKFKKFETQKIQREWIFSSSSSEIANHERNDIDDEDEIRMEIIQILCKDPQIKRVLNNSSDDKYINFINKAVTQSLVWFFVFCLYVYTFCLLNLCPELFIFNTQCNKIFINI